MTRDSSLDQPLPGADSRTATLDQLEVRLIGLTGSPLIGSADLPKVLGYTSQTALRRAWERGTLAVHTFTLKGRRGRFALAKDVASWLVTQAYPEIAADLRSEIPASKADEP